MLHHACKCGTVLKYSDQNLARARVFERKKKEYKLIFLFLNNTFRVCYFGHKIRVMQYFFI